MRSVPMLLATILLTVGCSTGTAFHTYDPSDKREWYDPSPRAYKGDVKVYYDKPPSKSFEDLGWIEARSTTWTTRKFIINAMKETAAKNGANAIVITIDNKCGWAGLDGGFGDEVEDHVCLMYSRAIRIEDEHDSEPQ